MAITSVQTFTLPTKATDYQAAPSSDYAVGRTVVISGKYTAAATYTLQTASTDTVEFQVGYAPANSRLLRAYINTDAVLYDSTQATEVNIGTDTTATFWSDGLSFGVVTTAITPIDLHYCDSTSTAVCGSGEKIVIKLIGAAKALTFESGKYIEYMFEFMTP